MTRLDRWETALNEATPGEPRDATSPDAMANNLETLALGAVLTASSRDQLNTWLTRRYAPGCPTIGASATRPARESMGQRMTSLSCGRLKGDRL